MSILIIRRWLCSSLALLLIALSLAGCAGKQVNLKGLEPTPQVDLQRYSGRWYIIANIPYFAERGKVGTRTEYRLLPDGRMEDLYYFRKGNFAAPEKRWEGVGIIQPGSGNAIWKSRFVWPFNVDYVVLDLDPDYQWVLIGHPDRDLAWIFYRQAQMDEPLYQRLLAKLAEQGFDPQRLRRIPQTRDQLGLPGFDGTD